MQNLIKDIYELNSKRDALESTLTKLKNDLNDLDSIIEDKRSLLLLKLKEANCEEFESGELVGFKQSKKNVGYSSEADVISVLKTSHDGKYIKTKITESIDKNALKKALKSDNYLLASLEPYISNTDTEYVVVTTKENRAKMLEHINESK